MANFDCHAEREKFCDELARSGFNQPDFSDLTVQVGSTAFHCHKVVLCAQSAWFKKAVTGGFKASHMVSRDRILADSPQESKADTIELVEDDVPAVKALLRFCYSAAYYCAPRTDGSTYLPGSAIEIDPDEIFNIHVRVFALAEKYFVPALERLAVTRLQQALFWEEPENDNAHIGFIASTTFTTCIRLAYNITADPSHILRAELIARIVKSPRVMERTQANNLFTELVESEPEFALDLARAFAAENWKNTICVKTYRCPCDCGATFEAKIEKDEIYTFEGCQDQGREDDPGYYGSEWDDYVV